MPDTYPAFVADLDEGQIEALIEMMFLAAASDGDFSPRERDEFRVNVMTMTAKLLSESVIDEMIKKAAAALEEFGRESRLASVKSRLPDQGTRKLALTLAIKMTAADGIIRTSERELIMETADALDIDGATAADLVSELSS